MPYDYSKSGFIKEYVDEITDNISRMRPQWDATKIRAHVEKKLYAQVQNPRIVMDNNVLHENREATMISVLDWINERKPIIAGNATFYKNQNEAINPIANMLDNMADRRKSFKKMMFSIDDFESPEYKDLDLKQANEKVNMNSYYGASGSPWSAFFSQWSGAATTGTAQSVISTTYTTFEAFIGDNYLFIDLDEFFHWCKDVLKRDKDFKIDSFILRKNDEDVVQRMKKKFYKWKDSYEDHIRSFLNSFSIEDLTRLYYKNNLQEFIKDHKEIITIYQTILENVPTLPLLEKDDKDWREKIPSFISPTVLEEENIKSVKDWNKYALREMFCDPNALPSAVKEDVVTFVAYLKKYVYAQYLSFDRIYRLKNFYRNTVTVIDTDSNILTLDAWVDFTKAHIMEGDYGRNNMNNIFIIINTIAYAITEVVSDILLFYGLMSNIPEEHRYRFNMKNEFFFTKLVIASVKKRYLSSIKLREGNLLTPEKTDIKGFDFRKSTTSEASSLLFKSYVEEYILKPEDIHVKELEDVIFQFRNEVLNSLKSGKNTYLPNVSIKEIQAYKEPQSEASIRGWIVWNLLYPDKEIDAPAKAGMLKLTLFKESDCEPLAETYPEIYQVIIDKIFHDKTGFFVSKNKKGDVKVRGVQGIVIPNNEDIPDWCLPYIDYTNMVNSILSPFKSVMDLLRIRYAKEGKTFNGISRKSDGLTNVIKF